MPAAPASVAATVAEGLLRIGAVALRPSDPFTWASGRLSPIYCDNRLTLAHPELRSTLAEALAERARALSPDVLAGTATAGIPHAALAADRLGLPMAYVRSAPKGHGKGNQIEGRIESGQRVVVIEDLISTGGSSLAAVEAVQRAGAEVPAVLALFTYGLDEAAARFAAAGVALEVLCDLGTLLQVAEHTGALDAEAVASLRGWRADPAAWSRARGGA